MKYFDINKLCEILHLKPIDKEPIMIKNCQTSLYGMNHDTVIFHLYKTETLDIKRLEKLNNCFIITDQPLLKKFVRVKKHFLYVNDIEKAYERFINFYRNQFRITTVAVTGTCGKSTTKEMIKQILSKKYRVTGTIGSRNSLRNNHDYLMEIDDNIDFGVYETAITDPGQLIYSAKFFKPLVGVITNIGIDHLSGCRTLENYIRAKGELLTVLNNDKGILVINGDDENIAQLDFSSYQGKIIRCSLKNDADFYATNITEKNDSTAFILHHQHKKYQVTIPTIGEHNVYNALLALAVVTALGMDIVEAIICISTFKPLRAHLEMFSGINGSTIIDDTWSSNPTSVKAALEVLQKLKGDKVLVIGNISYLGDAARDQAIEIGKMVVNYGVDRLITIDNFSKQIGTAAINRGMNPRHVIHCESFEVLDDTIRSLLRPDVFILFKTSMLDNKVKRIIGNYIITNDGQKK